MSRNYTTRDQYRDLCNKLAAEIREMNTAHRAEITAMRESCMVSKNILTAEIERLTILLRCQHEEPLWRVAAQRVWSCLLVRAKKGAAQ